MLGVLLKKYCCLHVRYERSIYTETEIAQHQYLTLEPVCLTTLQKKQSIKL